MKLAEVTLMTWRAVVSFRRKVLMSEIAEHPDVVKACRAGHYKLFRVVGNLKQQGYLASDSPGVGQDARYWFGPSCKLPYGEEHPGYPPVLSVCTDTSIATPRDTTQFAARELPPAPIRRGGLDYLKCPSRRGDLLYYRDGRVTRLNPDGSQTLIKEAS